jgi:oxalate decarboxylase/phosphoglucose isomerase-like protein (cupin superfamily)
VLKLVPSGAAHAVRNDGAADLWMVAVSSEPYNPAETVKRGLI